MSFNLGSDEQRQNISDPDHNSWNRGYSLLECIVSVVSALQYDQDFLGVISRGQNYIHKTKIKQTTITSR